MADSAQSGACLIAEIRLARERQVNVRVVPTGKVGQSVQVEFMVKYQRKIFHAGMT